MRRAIGNSGRGNMRNGLISLLTVVVVISMATAAVLAVSTSHAMGALAQRQATMTADGYALEQSGQALLANLDELLHQSRGGTAGGTVIAQVENRMNSLLVDSCAKGVTATYETADDGLTCTFVSEHGRMLTVTISVGGNATYDVRAWQLTAAPQEENTGDTLWTGSTAGE